MQGGDSAADNHEEELAGDPDKDVVGGPGGVGAVGELSEVLGLDAGADGGEDVEAEDHGQLDLLGGGVVELPEDGRRYNSEAGVCKGVEC